VKAQIDLALAQAEHARAQRALTLVTALEAVIEHDGKATASALVAQTLRRREGR
jgi:formyltetrahydrofolate synthetase